MSVSVCVYVLEWQANKRESECTHPKTTDIHTVHNCSTRLQSRPRLPPPTPPAIKQRSTHLLNEVGGIGTKRSALSVLLSLADHRFRKHNIAPRPSLLRLVPGRLAFEDLLAGQEKVQHDARGEKVGRLRVLLQLCADFRGHIPDRPAAPLALSGFVKLLRDAKVGQLRVPALADDHVVGLDVSVQNAEAVHVVERDHELGKVEGGQVFVQAQRLAGRLVVDVVLKEERGVDGAARAAWREEELEDVRWVSEKSE